MPDWHVVEPIEADPLELLVVRASAPPEGPGETIRRVLAEARVYARLQAVGVRGGLNIITYRPGSGGGLDLEVGVILSDPVEGAGEVVRSRTPGGPCAHTTHVGPYHEMGGAHAAARRWIEAEGRRATGVSWEIYGHWSEDPSTLVTDIYYQLR